MPSYAVTVLTIVGLLAEPGVLCLIDALSKKRLRAGPRFAISCNVATPQSAQPQILEPLLLCYSAKKYKKLYLFIGPANKNTTNHTDKGDFCEIDRNSQETQKATANALFANKGVIDKAHCPPKKAHFLPVIQFFNLDRSGKLDIFCRRVEVECGTTHRRGRCARLPNAYRN